MACFPFFSRKFKHAENNDKVGSIEGNTEGLSNVRLYTYKELSYATNGFSDGNKLGEGGFGAVYKARFKDGSLAAVKVLSSESQQGVKEFLTEINVISSVRHENLVELYGCLIDGKHHMLVYEYLENNSLSHVLLRGTGGEYDFNWKTRRDICVDIARGLACLHEAKPHILHRDIKASNILLDRNLKAKISDFGLAKLVPGNKTHVSTRVAGTIGYVAPEYAFSGHVSRKSDTYSFGVLLLEIISGRINTDLKLPSEERYLLEKAWVLYQRHEMVFLVDSSLDGQFDAEEACRFLKVALLCTQDSAKTRPPMSKVVRMLMGEEDVDAVHVSRPALISDFLMPRADVSGTSTSLMAYDTTSSEGTSTAFLPSEIYDKS